MGLRILHSIHSVNRSGGGPIEGLQQLAALNREQGHSVDIVSMDSPEAPWVQTCPLRCFPMGPSYLGYGYNSRLVPWLRRHRSEYDVVVVNGIWQYNAFGIWRALRGTPTPYFVFTHGMLDPWFKHRYPLKHLKKWLYWPWADYRVLRDAAAVLFTCEEERRLARKSFWLYACNERVVNYGTSGPSGCADDQKALFWRTFPGLVGKRCVLFIGRVHVKKGPDMLLSAFARLLRELPDSVTRDLRLVMAGPNDTPYGRLMMSLAERLRLEDRVVWTGMLTGDLKWGAFYAADVFMLPSHQENFGIAVVEALACGLPVLISDKVNIWREIEESQAGLIESDNLAGTLALMERWLKMSAAEQDAMRVHARQCFRERFHVQQSADLFIGILNSAGSSEDPLTK